MFLLSKEMPVDWPTAAVLIALAFSVMAVLSTYIAGRSSKK